MNTVAARRAVRNAEGDVHAHGRSPARWDTAGHVVQLHLAALPGGRDRHHASCEDAGTGSTYTLSAADVGKRLGVRVTATSSGGETTAASALTATVAQLALVNLAPPSVTGNAYAGETAERRRGPLDVPVGRRRLRVAALRRRRRSSCDAGWRRLHA